MAKRKRLEMTAAPETKSAVPPRARMPIAEVAGEVAGRAALEEMADAMTAAEREGRLVKKIPIERVDRFHMVRDRMIHDPEEMEILTASIAERGQQMPVEVMRIGARYALISGARRLRALETLGRTEVLALVRAPQDAAEAHLAMVEENEVRAPLSFYERANLAVAATGAGVFSDPATAVDHLFQRAPAAKRSKIKRFLVIREKLSKALSFPAAIPEKLGLRLASALEDDPGLARRLSDRLRKTPPADAAAERRAIEAALRGEPAAMTAAEEIAPGVKIETRRGRVVLTGAGVDTDLEAALREWLVSRAKR